MVTLFTKEKDRIQVWATEKKTVDLIPMIQYIMDSTLQSDHFFIRNELVTVSLNKVAEFLKIRKRSFSERLAGIITAELPLPSCATDPDTIIEDNCPFHGRMACEHCHRTKKAVEDWMLEEGGQNED